MVIDGIVAMSDSFALSRHSAKINPLCCTFNVFPAFLGPHFLVFFEFNGNISTIMVLFFFPPGGKWTILVPVGQVDDGFVVNRSILSNS